MGLIDTYHIATMGQNSNQTFTLASNGVLLKVTIEDVIIRRPGGSSSAGSKGYDAPLQRPKMVEVVVKKITVVATIDNMTYTETKIIEDMPDLKVGDIDIEVTDKDTKPNITIKLKK